MDPTELENAIEELEIRLERLRSLYEQYFLGIEKIEPTVARKDVDRRIWLLRREKIRNTAKRFKLQTIIQRYNTFQQYWQRVCREIENGTYKRHMLRAQRLAAEDLLTIAARKRAGRRHASSAPPAMNEALPATESAPPPPASTAPEARSSSIPAVPALRPITARPVPPRPASVRPPRAPEKPATAQPLLESLDFDFGFLGDWDPSEAAKKQSPRPLNAEPPPKPAAPSTARVAPPPKPARVPPPSTAARPAPPVATAPAPPAQVSASAPKPAPSAQASSAAQKSASAPTSAAVPRAPAPKPAAPKPAAPKPAAPQRPAPAAPGLTEERVRELHARLSEAKRTTKDPGIVSMETLAKSLRATEQKLREQHKNRRIEFDVVIKDGKAVVKPIVR